MKAINRFVAIVKAKQPFLGWAKRLPDPMAGMALVTLHDDSHAYLLPEYAAADEEIARALFRSSLLQVS